MNSGQFGSQSASFSGRAPRPAACSTGARMTVSIRFLQRQGPAEGLDHRGAGRASLNPLPSAAWLRGWHRMCHCAARRLNPLPSAAWLRGHANSASSSTSVSIRFLQRHGSAADIVAQHAIEQVSIRFLQRHGSAVVQRTTRKIKRTVSIRFLQRHGSAVGQKSWLADCTSLNPLPSAAGLRGCIFPGKDLVWVSIRFLQRQGSAGVKVRKGKPEVCLNPLPSAAGLRSRHVQSKRLFLLVSIRFLQRQGSADKQRCSSHELCGLNPLPSAAGLRRPPTRWVS